MCNITHLLVKELLLFHTLSQISQNTKEQKEQKTIECMVFRPLKMIKSLVKCDPITTYALNL